MTGSFCTIRIRLLGSEPSSHLFTEVGEFWKEHVFIVLWCCFLEAVLSPKPCCGRQCINTEEETGELKNGKELSHREKPKKAHSWAPDAQSLALYLVNHKQLLRKQSKYTTTRTYQAMQMAPVLGFRNICEPPKGNLRKSSSAKAAFPKLHFITFLGIWNFMPLSLRPFNSPGFHFTLEAQLDFVVLSRGWRNPRACGVSCSWFMSLQCRSQVQTCQGVRGCQSPITRLVAAGSFPLCEAGMPAQPPCRSVLHPPLMSWMNPAISLLFACQCRKNAEGRVKICCELGICENARFRDAPKGRSRVQTQRLNKQK